MRRFIYTHEWYQRLLAAGCAVSPPKKSDPLAKMSPFTPLGESMIYELAHNGVAYCAYVTILARKSFRLGSVELDTPFHSELDWLEPTKQQCPKREWEKTYPAYRYQIPTTGCIRPYDAVLNHHFEKHQRLQRGNRLEGALLLYDPANLIPQEFRKNQRLTLSLYDTLGEAVAACPVDFVFRARPKAKAELPRNWEGSSLFSDEVPSGSYPPYAEAPEPHDENDREYRQEMFRDDEGYGVDARGFEGQK